MASRARRRRSARGRESAHRRRALRGEPVVALTLVLGQLVGAAISDPSAAQEKTVPAERLRRVFTEEHGLPSAAVSALAQDRAGFLWVGTFGGLARFDGHEVAVMHRDVFGGGVHQLVVSVHGPMAIVERGRLQLYWLEGSEVRAARTRDGQSVRGVRWVSFDATGALWMVLEAGELLRLQPDGAALPVPDLPGRAVRLAGQLGGEMLIMTHERASASQSDTTTDSLWSWRPDSTAPELLASVNESRLRAALRREDGSLVYSTMEPTYEGRLHRLRGGASESEWRLAPVEHLVERQGELYTTDAFGLDILAAGGQRERLDTEARLFSGGPLLVDREGSLWLGTAEGLVQFPEPSTRSWHGLHGLPSGHTTDVEPVGDRVFVSTWQGLGLLQHGPLGWRARNLEREGIRFWPGSRLCADASRRVWLSLRAPGSQLASIAGETLRRHRPLTWPMDCDPLADGSLLILADDELLLVRAGAATEEPLGPVPGRGQDRWIAGAADGRLAVQIDERVCFAQRRELQARGLDAWSCEALSDVGEVRDIVWVEGPRGEELWLASFSGGTLRRLPGGSWQPVAALAEQPTRAAAWLRRSRRGGVWVTGFGFSCRLVSDDGEWRIAERLGVWHGASGGARTIAESDDGALWLSTWRGVTRIPAAARTGPDRAPPIALVEQRVDGQPVDGRTLEIGSGQGLELRFAGLSLRDPERVSYRLRIGEAEPWFVSRDPIFRFMQPAPGSYEIEAASSLDGANWSVEPVRSRLRVVGPWYRRPPAILAWIVGGLLLSWTAHRLRTAHLLSLERQRTRIAMDLHDELGAGLGSVGILGGVLANGPGGAADVARLGERIAQTAGELGESLHDILGSLRTGSIELDKLFGLVASRARSLLARARGAEAPRLVIDAPEPVPRLRFELAEGHHLQALLLEALHNAVRHAGASVIELGLAMDSRQRALSFWVQDDGLGFDPDAASTGMGLEGMRRRARALGAELRLGERKPGEGGTRVELRMPAPSPLRRWWSWRRRRFDRAGWRRTRGENEGRGA